MKSIFTLISLFLLSQSIFTQSLTPIKFKHQLGVHAGFSTGLGISYRYWPGIIGVQATILPIKTDDNWTDILGAKDQFLIDDIYGESGSFTSLGLTALITMKQGTKGKLFSYLGNHYIITDHDEKYNLGLGFGLAVESRVSFNFMLGYGAYDVTGDYLLLPTSELGIYVRF